MKDKLKLKLLRFAMLNSSSLEEAREFTDFILAKNQSVASIPKEQREGVYIKFKGGRIHPWRTAEERKDSIVKVGIFYRGHWFGVALHDLECGKTTLLKKDAKVPEGPWNYKNQVEAINDFEAKANTEHLRKSGLAFKLPKDMFIPTTGMQVGEYLFREDLDKALVAAGGEPLKYEGYWSSSENSRLSSWYLNFGNGYIGYSSNNVKYLNKYVRPCTAFEL